MLRVLNKIAGSLVALILYPIKALIVSATLAAVMLILTALLLVALPIAFFLLADEILGKIALSLVALVMVPIIGTVLTLGMLGRGIWDTFCAVEFGLRDGYQHGLFFHVLGRFLFDIRVFSPVLQSAFMFINAISSGQNETMNDEAFAQLGEQDDYSDLVDVPRSPNELPDIDQAYSNRRKFEPLSDEDLALAATIGDLSSTLVIYTDLHKRLTALDSDIKQRADAGDLTADLEEVTDELVYVGIKQPTLLVKQYQDENGRWLAIPGRTKIIDRAFIEKWIREHNNSHPETREPLDKAEPHNMNGTERPARYRLVNYTNMNNAQELIEASVIIRRKLEQANPRNIEMGRVAEGVSGYLRAQGLFGGTQAPNGSGREQYDEERGYVVYQ